MKIGKKEFDFGKHTYIMGILNVTPDSFSDGGKYNQLDLALKRAEKMIEEGADILDIGGESTRPGYTFVKEKEEIERVVPVITAIKERLDIPVSVDTYKGEVAKAAVMAGADLVNDIWGLKYDDILPKVIAEHNLPCCLMHNRKEKNYQNFMDEVFCDFSETIQIAQKAGISNDKIILDPGVGFGKTYEQNLEVIRKLEQFHSLGYPILLGTSRKSVIGLTLDLPTEERVEGTLVTTVMAVMKKCALVRVHDVKENKRAITMTEAILNG